MSAAETALTVDSRTAESWPKHRAKARHRSLLRARTARLAQAKRDKEAR